MAGASQRLRPGAARQRLLAVRRQGRAVYCNHFTGDGDPRTSYTEDPAVAKLCATAFESVWERAVPHEQYTV
nr:DUF6879 family protein [Kitasatospora sp. NBC_01246]